MEKMIALAISKGTDKLANGLALSVGKHTIDQIITVRVTGTITKSEDEMYTPTMSIPLKAAFALLLEKSGITREASSRLLLEAMQDALKLGESSSEMIKDRLNQIDEAEETVQKLLGKLPKEKRAGKTVCKVLVEELTPQVA